MNPGNRILLVLVLSEVFLHHPAKAAFVRADPPKEDEHMQGMVCPTSVLREFEEGLNVCFDPIYEQNDGPNKFTMRQFFGVFHKLGTSWKSVVGMFREIVRWTSGTNENGDVYANTMEEALSLMRHMASVAASTTTALDDEKQNSSTINPMLLRTVPLQEFNVTKDDVFLLFLRWSITDGAKDDRKRCKRRGSVNGKRNGTINVSKAFRRLSRYATWMENTGGDSLLYPPLTASSLKEAWGAFSMTVSYDDCNRLVWWLDLGKTSLDGVRALAPEQVLRLYIWFAHLMLFDRNAQENGVVFINDLGRAAFGKFMTMLPFELGMKLDEFMISVIPLKTKLVVFMNRPPWAKFGYSLLSVFMTRSMKRRVLMVPEERVKEEVWSAVGPEYIPVGFGGLNGTLAKDPYDINERIFSDAGVTAVEPAP